MAGETVTPHAVVTVDGVPRAAKSVRVTRELATDMPAQVAAGGGMVAATANVEWADDRNGVADSRAPIVAPNARVNIDAGISGAGGSLFRRFTGKLDSSSGGAADQSNGSALVDDTSRLDRAVTTPCHFSQEVSGVGIAYVGLGTPWMAYEVARQCSMSAYHYSTATTMLWASLAGSTLPSNAPVPGYGDNAAWNPKIVPDGVGIDIAPGRFIEFAHNPIGAGGGVAVEASFWTDPGAAGYVVLGVRGWKSATGQRGPQLLVGNGAVDLMWQDGSTTTYITPSPYAAPSGWQPVALHMFWGSAGYQIRVRVGATIYGPFTVAASDAYDYTATAKWATMLSVYSSETVTKTVAGLVVDRLTTTTPAWSEHTYTPRFKYEGYQTQLLSWLVMPPQDSRQGLDILKQMSSAELAGLWVDEDGVLRYRTRVPLRSAGVTKVVTSLDSLLDYSWSYSLDALRKRVIVKWRRPTYTVRTDYTLPVWDSGDQTWKQTDPEWTQFVDPGSDEDWLDVSTTVVRGYEKQRNTISWWSGEVKKDSDNTVVRTGTSGDLAISVAGLGGSKARYLVNVQAQTAVGSTNYLAGKVVLNARGKATWTDETTYSTGSLSTGVPSDAPDLVHDVGWMMQSTGQAETVADYLAMLLAAPLVEVDNVQIVPDPSIRLGEKVRVEDAHVKGWSFEGVVSRIDESWADGQASMTLGLRVTLFEDDFAASLAQLDARWAGVSLASFDAAHSGKTLSQLDAAPLA